MKARIIIAGVAAREFSARPFQKSEVGSMTVGFKQGGENHSDRKIEPDIHEISQGIIHGRGKGTGVLVFVGFFQGGRL
jgi:chorismate synthase